MSVIYFNTYFALNQTAILIGQRLKEQIYALDIAKERLYVSRVLFDLINHWFEFRDIL